MKKAEQKEQPIITVIGMDTQGIVAQVATLLWKRHINIEEIKQGVIDGHFFMIMSVDLEGSGMTFHQLSVDLKKLATKIGLDINIYNKKVFTAINKL